jgi:hypothetical protein
MRRVRRRRRAPNAFGNWYGYLLNYSLNLAHFFADSVVSRIYSVILVFYFCLMSITLGIDSSIFLVLIKSLTFILIAPRYSIAHSLAHSLTHSLTRSLVHSYTSTLTLSPPHLFRQTARVSALQSELDASAAAAAELEVRCTAAQSEANALNQKVCVRAVFVALSPPFCRLVSACS